MLFLKRFFVLLLIINSLIISADQNYLNAFADSPSSNSLSFPAGEEVKGAYLHMNTPENQLIIQVKPIEQRVVFKEDEIDHSIQLPNGTKAVYSFGNRINRLSFEKDGWQYILNANKRASEVMELDMLAAIASTLIKNGQ
ncbi:hypothetical protein [Domibacillus indicus]|uniref:hypothetical protein n=1 Tax=Domibacillus indicus TaxID=1437523 RepID=UPI000617F878|nr:hypothetical protein [Domibacillus indicus]